MTCEKCKVQHEGSYGSGRFCSIKCARGYSTYKNRDLINKSVSATLSRIEGYFCPKCDAWFALRTQITAHDKIHVKKFEDLKTDRYRRIWLIRERGHRCEICFNTEWNTQTIPIELDHISGDADDNTKANLRLICPNCHALTPTYKGKNKASASRKRRYIRNIRVPVADDVF